ncbi:MAG: response regulator, partial [Planctomycetota bacterium]
MLNAQRILVVEDEEALALGVRDALEHAGYAVELAHDGPTALARIRAEEYDLVVLDLMLPGMNGLDVLRAVRQENANPRFLILSALAEESDILRGFDSGAEDYLKKPFSPKELVARVSAQFRRRDLD